MTNKPLTSSLIGCFFISIGFLLSGCSTPSSGVGPTKNLDLKTGYQYSLDHVSIPLDANYEIDAAGLLREALESSLRGKDLLVDEAHMGNHYVINAYILDYEMGNAFKRWLLPAYGSTILSIKTEIIDPQKGSVITELEHRQMIGTGGAYSIGAWNDIFASVAEDIVTDIERKRSGEGKDFVVNLDPWLEKDTLSIPRAINSQSIHVEPLADLRDQQFRIGERHAAFNVSMGSVYPNRQVAAFLTEAIKNELLAAGNELRAESGYVNVSGEVTKFWVWTDTTMTYWDVNGEVHVTLTADCPDTDAQITRTYTANASERTYVWPGEDLVGGVVAEAVKSLMLDIRQDSIWTRLN